MRGQGGVPGRKYVRDTLGWNFRITELAAAIGRRRLDGAGSVMATRPRWPPLRRAVEALPPMRSSADSLSRAPWPSYASVSKTCDAVARSPAERVISSLLNPVPAYRQGRVPEYRRTPTTSPNAELASADVLNLPLFFEMT